MKAFKLSEKLDKNKVFIINKNELEGRFDPLFYASDIFGFIKETKFNVKTVKEVSRYAIAGFGAGREDQDLTEKGYIQIRPTNIGEFGRLKFDKNIYLDSTYFLKKKENIIQKDDVLFNNTNSQELVGKTSYFDLDGTFFHSNHITRIGVKKDLILPKFLWHLLNFYQQRKVFYSICTNWNNQSGVGLELLNSLKIPVPPKAVQEKIVQIMDSAYLQKKQNEAESEKLLASIDDYLLSELGIKLPKENNDLGDRMFKLNFSELESRLDPFYYMAEFKEIESNIIKSGLDVVALENIFFINRGGSPRPIDKFYTEDANGVNWIKIGDTKNDDKYIYSTKQKIKPEGAKFSRKVEIGDFILSNSMSFGRPYIMMISGYIHDGWLLFKPKTTKVDKDYLYNILSSKLVYRLFKRATIGGVVDNLNIDLVKKIKIPLPPLAKQTEIANHITKIRQKAQSLKDKSNLALQQANKEIEHILLGNES